MSDKAKGEQSLEQTLETLDQLRETLDVMSGVVERLREHMTRQLSHNAELFRDEGKVLAARQAEVQKGSRLLRDESLVVEIAQMELEEGVDPVLH